MAAIAAGVIMDKPRALILSLLLTVGMPSTPIGAQDMSMSDEEAEAISSALSQAVAAMQSGAYPEAIELLEPLSRRLDAPAQVKALLGAAYVEDQRPQQALAVLEPLIGSGEDPAVLFNAGRAALLADRVQDGEAYLERAATLAPGSPAARFLGMLRGKQGRAVDAYRLLRPLALARPDDFDVRLAAATSGLQLRRLAETETLLTGMPKNDVRVRLLWGRLLLLQGNPHAALEMTKPLDSEAEAAKLIQTDVHRLLADIHLEMGNPSAALALLEKLPVTDTTTQFKLGQAYFRSGNVEAALATLEPFKERLLDPPDDHLPPDVRRRRAILAGEIGRYQIAAGMHEEARAMLEAATVLDPQLASAWQLLGQSLAVLGDSDGAKQALERFQTLSAAKGSNTAIQHRVRADLDDATGRELRKVERLVGEGRFSAALGLVRTELALSPQDPRPLLAESRILLLTGRHDEALQSVERAITSAPDLADVWYQRGAVRLASKNLDGAEQDFRHALEIDERHTAALNDLAVLLIVSDRRDEARSLLERVLAINPGDRGAAQNLERLNSRSDTG